jgi:hypothetical protein
LQVLLSGHFILFFSMFVLIVMFSIFPVLYLYMRPTPSNLDQPADAALSAKPVSTDAKPPAPDDPPPPPKPEPSSSGPGLLSLLICIISAATVLLGKQSALD